jgi:hypothetical protein
MIEIVNSKIKELNEVFTTENDILDFKKYIKELIEEPQQICNKTQKVLLLYIASIQFVVLSFDVNQYLDEDLIISCNVLAKKLYSFYKDINTLLYTKKIEHLWKEYVKINNIAGEVSTKASHRISMSRDKILADLHYISVRIKTI